MIETEKDVAADTQRPLPDGWRWVRLSEVGRFESGGTPSKDERRFWGGKIPFVTGADITSFYVDGAQARARLTDEGLLSEKTAVCGPGTVLFVTRTRVGRVGIAAEKMGASQDLSPYVCGARLMPEYVCWHLLSISDYLIANCRGSTILGLTRDFVESLEIPLAPIAEQRRIAAILREQMAAVEQARAAAEAQLEAARALPAAYLRAVFESDVVRDAGTRRLGDICRIVAPQVDPRKPEYGALPHVNGENIVSGTCRLLYLRTAAEEGMISGKYLFDEGDVLYSKLRPYLRKVVVAELRGVCSADMYPIKVERHTLDPYFLAWTLVSDGFTSFAEEESRRARMPKLNREQLLSWEMPVPSLAEQTRIAAMLRYEMAGADRTRQAVEGQRDLINQLPAALLRQAFTGEL